MKGKAFSIMFSCQTHCWIKTAQGMYYTKSGGPKLKIHLNKNNC